MNDFVYYIQSFIDICFQIVDGSITCPKDWLAFEGYCYYFSTSNTTFNDAVYTCNDLNSSLTSFDTLEEFQFLSNTITGKVFIKIIV